MEQYFYYKCEIFFSKPHISWYLPHVSLFFCAIGLEGIGLDAYSPFHHLETSNWVIVYPSSSKEN